MPRGGRCGATAARFVTLSLPLSESMHTHGLLYLVSFALLLTVPWGRPVLPPQVELRMHGEVVTALTEKEIAAIGARQGAAQVRLTSPFSHQFEAPR